MNVLAVPVISEGMDKLEEKLFKLTKICEPPLSTCTISAIKDRCPLAQERDNTGSTLCTYPVVLPMRSWRRYEEGGWKIYLNLMCMGRSVMEEVSYKWGLFQLLLNNVNVVSVLILSHEKWMMMDAKIRGALPPAWGRKGKIVCTGP